MSLTDRLPFLDRSDPESWKALNGLSLKVTAAAESAGLERETLELMNVRISQLNRCAFCIDLHTRKALEAGATVQRVALLPVWRDSDLYDEVDRAVLAIADVTTQLPDPDVRDTELGLARTVLGDVVFTAVEWAAITMNTYNRVSILSQHPVKARTD